MFKALFLLILFAFPLYAQESLSPEVGKPLQEAQKLIKAGKPEEALKRLAEVDALVGRNSYEIVILEQTRFAAALAAANPALAAKSLERLQNVGGLSAALRLQFTQAVAVGFFNAKNYPEAINWASNYLNQGGNEPSTKLVLAYSQYLSNDFLAANRIIAALVLDAEKKSQPIPENYIQLGLNIGIQQKDDAIYLGWLKKKIKYHPTGEDWAALIDRSGMDFNVNPEAGLLKLETGGFNTSLHYTNLAEIFVRQGFPGLAQEIMAKGFKAGILGQERDKRLQEFINKNADEDKKTLASIKADFNHGLALYSYGEKDAGFKLMEEALNNKEVPENRLKLGIYYLLAGQNALGVAHLKQLKNNQLAELWLLKVGE